MANTSAHTHYSAVLTNLSVQFKPPGLVAERIVRRVPVTNETDVYPVFDKALFDAPDDHRADGAPENESSLGWKYEPYVIEPHGLRDKITRRMRKNADSQIDLEALKNYALKQKILNGLEKRVFGSGGLLRTTANNVAATNGDWTNRSTMTPREDVNAICQTVQQACGLRPNTMALSPTVLDRITESAQYKDEAKHVVDLRDDGRPGRLYGLDVVEVGSLLNTAKKGQASSLGYLMGEDVWIGFVPGDGETGLQMMAHSILLWTEEYARKWWDDESEVDWVAYNFNYVPKMVAKECGGLLTSVLT